MAKAKTKSNYSVGKNPESLKNLNRDGRPSGEEIYGEPKKKRTLTVTESGWQGAVKAVRALGYSSVSEYLERFGRQEPTSSA
jgi:hypothetical protein